MAEEKAGDERFDAMHAVFETVPTTFAGLRAKIDFISDDHVTESLTETTDGWRDVLDTLYEAARMMAVRS
jgi:hypothetical protein